MFCCATVARSEAVHWSSLWCSYGGLPWNCKKKQQQASKQAGKQASKQASSKQASEQASKQASSKQHCRLATLKHGVQLFIPTESRWLVAHPSHQAQGKLKPGAVFIHPILVQALTPVSQACQLLACVAGVHLTLHQLAQQRIAMPCQLPELAVEQSPDPQNVVCLVDAQVSCYLQGTSAPVFECTVCHDVMGQHCARCRWGVCQQSS